MKQAAAVLFFGMWMSAQVPSITVVANQKFIVFRTATQVYTLPQVPVFSHPQVFHNGLLMLEGTDYTISGATITFLVPISVNPIIQVFYFAT